ncbi:MAG: cobalamin-dependent protein [Candidatus Aminicenantes bacterium]|nr:cobalamin-dependent protein [Candidatus Aminicenantes bacterium]
MHLKILLIHPKLEKSYFSDIRLPPLGLAYIAAALREAGFNRVRILDANISRHPNEEILGALSSEPPDVVGLSLTTPLFETGLEISRTIKKRSPETKVIFGGVHPTIFPGDVAGMESVDFVVFGEGERTVVDLARALEQGRSPDDVSGVAFKRDGRVIINAPRPFIKDLDELPLPAYDLLPIRRYSNPQSAHAPLGMMLTSRGCPFRCIFCDSRIVLGKKYRAYSAPRMIREWRILVGEFGVKEIMFKESDFTLDRERVLEFCELLMREPKRIPWTCNGHIGLMDPVLLREMRRSGCRLIQYGVESGDQNILDTLKKNITIPQVIETFRMTREAGIRAVANIMIGNPGDTRETIARSIALAKDIKADFANFQSCAPFPGTELHRMAAENGWFLGEGDALHLRSDSCSMNATDIPTPELRGMLKKAYRSFYFRPTYILRRLASLNIEDWRTNLRGLLKLTGIS